LLVIDPESLPVAQERFDGFAVPERLVAGAVEAVLGGFAQAQVEEFRQGGAPVSAVSAPSNNPVWPLSWSSTALARRRGSPWGRLALPREATTRWRGWSSVLR